MVLEVYSGPCSGGERKVEVRKKERNTVMKIVEEERQLLRDAHCFASQRGKRVDRVPRITFLYYASYSF